jgi:hypothetical protein
MNYFNNAVTGINEIDNGINTYFNFISNCNVLPDGTYVLAGGCMRALLDKTRVRDLDVYILGDKDEHNRIMEDLGNTLTIQKFANPFASFRVVNIGADVSKHLNRNEPKVISVDEDPFMTTEPMWPDPDRTFSAPIQLISFAYDKEYFSRFPADIKVDERFADTYASSVKEIVNSFDLTLSKAAVEFTIGNDILSVNTVSIPHDCLIDICMRKLRLAPSDKVIPQQLCTIKRFHKLTKLGYDVDESFYLEWKTRLKANPHVLECEYDDD